MDRPRRARQLARVLILVALVPLALSMGACSESTTGASDVSGVEWSSSFGFCPPESYCTTRLRVTGLQAVLTFESRVSPTMTTEATLSAAEAEALAAAAAQVRFDALPPVFGCPDCADGGAETLTVIVAGEPRSVTFEYNKPIDPLEPLLGQVRSLVARMRVVAL